MSAIINGDSPSITFSDGTTQATSAIVSGKVPYTNLPTGSVLQVVNVTYGTQSSTASNSLSDTGLTATITPKYATSKILVDVNVGGCDKNGSTYMRLTLNRGAGIIVNMESQVGYNSASGENCLGSVSASYLDSPATTSATTYKVQFANAPAVGTVYINIGTSTSSTMTLMEIAQ